MKKKINIKSIFFNPLFPVWFGAFVDILVLSTLGPYLPRILLDMGASIPQTGLLLSVNIFIGFFSGILWGALSDKFGRRSILIICLAGTMVGNILLAFSTSISIFLISRIIDGIFARSTQIILTIIGDLVPPEKRSKEMSKPGAGWIAGGLIGPIIGGLLIRSGIFGFGIFNSVLYAAALVITILLVKESNPPSQEQGELKTLPREARKPIISVNLLKKRTPRLLLGQSLFNLLSGFIFRFSITLFVTEKFGFSIVQLSQMLTFVGIINLLVRIVIFPRILKKLGDEKTLIFGFITFVIAFIWLIFMQSVFEFIVISVLVSLGTTCSVDLMNGIMSKEVSQKDMGEMIGLNAAVESITLVLAPIIGSYLISLPNTSLFGVVAAGTSLLPLLISFIPRHKKSELTG